MGRLFDDVARTLATPMPRRELIRRLLLLVGTATVLGQRTVNATGWKCGHIQFSHAIFGSGSGKCLGFEPDAALKLTAKNSGKFNCPSSCPKQSKLNYVCLGGDFRTGVCGSGWHQCLVAATAKCSSGCTPSSCGPNKCCCTSTGNCLASTGGGGNCVAGFAGC